LTTGKPTSRPLPPIPPTPPVLLQEGAVLTNAGKGDDAIAAFDKCIAADPTRADAYYQKGVNLIGKATLQGDKTIAPPGTAEAFNKYLELQPPAPTPTSQTDVAYHRRQSLNHYGTKEPKKSN